MNIHVFNPDTDMALASGLANYTAPKVARVMARDLALLPSLWAEQGDAVVVSDVERSGSFLLESGLATSEVRLVGPEGMLAPEFRLMGLCPWGWNRAIVAQMRRRGLGSLPADSEVDVWRSLSGRHTSVEILSRLRAMIDCPSVGESWICTSADEVSGMVVSLGRAVLKAPWSCSGRGVRFVSAADFDGNTSGWVRRVLDGQGAVEVEPMYGKVVDFAMEFTCADGRASYCGLSLFTSVNGAYSGNLVASEQLKEDMLSRYVHPTALRSVRIGLESVLSQMVAPRYSGICGVDMMICCCPDGSMAVHPCVEMNLRRTMGWVSLVLNRFVRDGSSARYFIDYDADSLRLNARVSDGVASGRLRLLTPLLPDSHYVALLDSEEPNRL